MANDVDKAYRRALELAREIVRTKMGALVRATGGDQESAAEDVAQSLLGTERVVHLITTRPFERSLYEPALVESANEVARAFFPDAHKRFFQPLGEDSAAIGSVQEAGPGEAKFEIEEATALLPAGLRPFFLELVGDSTGAHQARTFDTSPPDSFAERVERIRRHFPDGRIPPLCDRSPSEPMSDEAIELHARYVAARLEIGFPWGFFSKDARRIGVAVRYLVTHEMRVSLEEALEADIISFVALGLGPALRRCGASVNRLLGTGFPEQIRPWMGSHVPDGYWSEAANRIDAVRWLVETRLGIQPEGIGDAVHSDRLTKSSFRSAGLTWLLKNVYGWSVADALAEAYPQLRPWERFRRVPVEEWQGDAGRILAGEALRWAFRKEGIEITGLRRQDAARHIQSLLKPWNLGPAFRIAFSNDPVALLSFLYPNTFRPWEVTHIPRESWNDERLRVEAVQWLLTKLGIAVEALPDAIRNGTLTPDVLKNAGLDGLLRRSGSVWRLVDAVYPGRFTRWELTTVPVSHWRTRSNVREAVLWILRRNGVPTANVETAMLTGLFTAETLVQAGLGGLVHGVFRGDLRAMLQVADVLPSPRRVPLSRFFRQTLSPVHSGIGSRKQRLAFAGEIEHRLETFRKTQRERRKRAASTVF